VTDLAVSLMFFAAGLMLVAVLLDLLVFSPPKKRISKMLVLSRKALPDENTITLLVDGMPDFRVNFIIDRVANGTVRIGIEAPSEVRILRGELVEHSAALQKDLSHGRV